MRLRVEIYSLFSNPYRRDQIRNGVMAASDHSHGLEHIPSSGRVWRPWTHAVHMDIVEAKKFVESLEHGGNFVKGINHVTVLG